MRLVRCHLPRSSLPCPRVWVGWEGWDGGCWILETGQWVLQACPWGSLATLAAWKGQLLFPAAGPGFKGCLAPLGLLGELTQLAENEQGKKRCKNLVL